MKVIFQRNVDCDLFDKRMQEQYPKYFSKWTEVQAEGYEREGKVIHIALTDGNTLLNVPRNAVEIL